MYRIQTFFGFLYIFYIYKAPKMTGNRAGGPDRIPFEVWKTMGEQGIVFLEKQLNEVITSGIPYSWRLSELTPLFKGKCSILECSNYRGIKLISHTLKLLERIIDQRLRHMVELGNNETNGPMQQKIRYQLGSMSCLG